MLSLTYSTFKNLTTDHSLLNAVLFWVDTVRVFYHNPLMIDFILPLKTTGAILIEKLYDF